MAVYFVARIAIKDQEKYDQYGQAARATIPGNAKVLAVDFKAETVEGEWPGTHTVMLEFPDEAAFRAWYNSPAYQEALKLRLAGTESNSVLLHGLE